MSRGRPMVRWRGLAAGTVVLASMVAACGGSQRQEQPTDGPGDTSSRVLASATEAADSVVSAVGESLGIARPKPARENLVPAVEAHPVRLPKPSAPAAPAPSAPDEVAPVADNAAATLAAVPADLTPEEVVEEPEAPVRDFTLYSSADVDVVPPTPPPGSPLRPWRTSHSEPGLLVEVIVAHDGTAEKVRMLGVVRLSDATTLSQVKAWKFTPALRAGEPVRYRVILQDPALAP